MHGDHVGKNYGRTRLLDGSREPGTNREGNTMNSSAPAIGRGAKASRPWNHSSRKTLMGSSLEALRDGR